MLALGADDGLDGELPDEDTAKRLLYRLGPDRFALQVLLAWAGSDAAPDDSDWREALTLPARWEAPVFPLRGPDVTALGNLKGPEIGALLRAVEQAWIDGGFAETREKLLERAKAHMAKASAS